MGRLIPAGSGFKKYRQFKMAAQIRAEEADESLEEVDESQEEAKIPVPEEKQTQSLIEETPQTTQDS